MTDGFDTFLIALMFVGLLIWRVMGFELSDPSKDDEFTRLELSKEKKVDDKKD